MLKSKPDILKSVRSGLNKVALQLPYRKDSPRRRTKTKQLETHVKPFYLQWVSVKPLLASVHALSLPAEQNEALLLKIYDTLHLELLDETLRHIPRDKHQQFLAHMKEMEDPDSLFTHYGVSHEMVKEAVTRRGDNVIKNLRIALKKGSSSY